MTGLFDEGAAISTATPSRRGWTMPARRCASAPAATRIYGSMRMLADQQGRGARPAAAGDRSSRASTQRRSTASARRSSPASSPAQRDPRDRRAGQMGRGALWRPSLCAPRRRHRKDAGDDHRRRSARLPQGSFARDNLHVGGGRRDRRRDAEARTGQAVRRPAGKADAEAGGRSRPEARPGGPRRLRSAADLAAARLSGRRARRARISSPPS